MELTKQESRVGQRNLSLVVKNLGEKGKGRDLDLS